MAWRAAFDAVFAGIAGMFYRAESRRWARSYLTGLPAPVERKDSWQLSDAAGVVAPDGLQHFLNRSRWEADELRDRLRSYAAGALACPNGVLVVDETGFVKIRGEIGGCPAAVLRHRRTRGEPSARGVPRLRCRRGPSTDRPRAVFAGIVGG